MPCCCYVFVWHNKTAISASTETDYSLYALMLSLKWCVRKRTRWQYILSVQPPQNVCQITVRTDAERGNNDVISVSFRKIHRNGNMLREYSHARSWGRMLGMVSAKTARDLLRYGELELWLPTCRDISSINDDDDVDKNNTTPPTYRNHPLDIHARSSSRARSTGVHTAACHTRTRARARLSSMPTRPC